MKDFIEYVAKSLLNPTPDLALTEYQDETKYHLKLHAPRAELGKVIGKHGHMAEALRTIAGFYATKILKKPLNFRIVDDTNIH